MTVLAIADCDTFGGLFLAQTGEGRDRDREIILGLGFTILLEEPRAGEVKMWVHGPVSSVDTVLADYELKVSLPGLFFPLPEGEEITMHLLYSWAPRENLFFT